MRIILVSLSLFVIASGAPGPAAPRAGEPTPAAAETRAEVPELTEFHEIIYQLWHGAWPEKDYEAMKALLPEAVRHVRAIEAARLPGILRDKKPDWDRGVQALSATLAGYRAAADSGDGAALMDSVEQLHARFEALLRLVHPAMEELDAYHVVLYEIFHYWKPERKLDDLRHAASGLADRCEAFEKAPVPSRFADIETSLKSEIGALCSRTSALEQAAGTGDWNRIDQAVESVHDQYVAIERMFDPGS